jgi:hypothetical protein
MCAEKDSFTPQAGNLCQRHPHARLSGLIAETAGVSAMRDHSGDVGHEVLLSNLYPQPLAH